MTTIVHLKRQGGKIVQDCDVYIGRACHMGGWNLPESIWFNPYTIKKHGSTENVLKLYEAYIRNQPDLLSKLPDLVGKRLGCWCKPKDCHGDILLKLINERLGVDVSRRGRVACNRIVHFRAQGDKHHPILKDYININVTSASKKWGGLSPMKLGPFILAEELHPSDLYQSGVEPGFKRVGDEQKARVEVFENYWQGSKIYDIDLNDDDTIKVSFFNRRAKMFSDVKGHRRALPKAQGTVIAAYFNGEVFDYIESRYYYCFYYSYLVQRTAVYQELVKMIDNGQNLQILGYDGQEYTNIDAETMYTAYLDPTYPFGHELVLCCLLMNLRPWEIN